MDTKTNSKWYNNESLVDTLLFIIPPVGIYGLYKTKLFKSKIIKVLYGGIGFISFLLGVIYVIKY